MFINKSNITFLDAGASEYGSTDNFMQTSQQDLFRGGQNSLRTKPNDLQRRESNMGKCFESLYSLKMFNILNEPD